MKKLKNILKYFSFLLLVLQPVYGSTEIALTLDGSKYSKGEWRILTRSHGEEGFQQKVASFPGGSVLEEILLFQDVGFTTSELYFISDTEGQGWVDSYQLFVSDENPKQLKLVVIADTENLTAESSFPTSASMALGAYHNRYNELLRQLWYKETEFRSATEVEAFFTALLGDITTAHEFGSRLKEYLEFRNVVNYMEICRRGQLDFSAASLSPEELLEKFDTPYFMFVNESRQCLARILDTMVPKTETPLGNLENTVVFLNTRLESEEIRNAMADYYFSSFINRYSNRSPDVFEKDLKAVEEIAEKLSDQELALEWLESFKKIRHTFKGSEVPDITFLDLEGKELKFKDLFDGENYVYIDLWATWCIPCIKEIPFLEKVEEKYHDKNIRFISISVDATEEIWRNRGISKYDLKGEQYLDKDARVLKDLQIIAIPRFLFYDPQGNWISMDAPRPSDAALVELLDTHLK